MVSAHIRERAQIWSAEDNIQLHYFSWHQFCSLLCDRFPEANWYDSMDHFQHLKQINSTDNYIDQFETWMQLMTRDNPYLPEYFFVLRFISGQKDNVKRMVKCHKPNTARCIRVLQAARTNSFGSSKKTCSCCHSKGGQTKSISARIKASTCKR